MLPSRTTITDVDWKASTRNEGEAVMLCVLVRVGETDCVLVPDAVVGAAVYDCEGDANMEREAEGDPVVEAEEVVEADEVAVADAVWEPLGVAESVPVGEGGTDARV